MSGKNLVFELWVKNLSISDIAGFLELQYMANELRYEVKFSYVKRRL